MLYEVITLKLIAKEGDVKTFFRVHNEFHEVFIKAAGNEKLYEMINQLVMRFKRLRLASLSQPGRMEISVEEHRNMIQAFKKHDGDSADSLVRHAATIGADVLIQSRITSYNVCYTKLLRSCFYRSAGTSQRLLTSVAPNVARCALVWCPAVISAQAQPIDEAISKS